MAFRIQNNIAALNAQRNLGVSETGMNKSLERLSSGYRINSAKDDAAGLAVSSAFRANIASVQVAQRNITEANALLQTAEGAMASVGDILTRMKELATQAASANAGTNLDKISAEYDTLVSEIDRIANSTKYAGSSLVNGDFTTGNTTSSWNAVNNIYDVSVTNAAAGNYTVTYCSSNNALNIAQGTVNQTITINDGAQSVNFSAFGITFKTTAAFNADAAGAAMDTAELAVSAGTDAKDFQIGYLNDGYSKLGVSIDSIKSTSLGVAAGDISTITNAQAALSTIDNAISALASSRAEVGAYQNRLSYAAANLDVTLENFTAAESAIRDVDMAAEMTNFTKNQILVQAGVAMLSQANQAPQLILSLFR